MSVSDFMTGMKNLQKSHDLIGNGQKIYSHAKTFKDSASTCLKTLTANPEDEMALKKIVGIGDKETQKLLATMAKIQKIAEETSRAKFPEVKSFIDPAWNAWYKTCARKGKDSKEADRERKNYMRVLKAYDKALEERIHYCQAVANVADRHIKTYSGVEAATAAGINVAIRLLSLPELADMPYHAAALSIILKYQAIPPAAKRVVKAHQTLKFVADSHQKSAEKLRKYNAINLADMAKKDLPKLLKKALQAAGVKF
jgi:hypothetical protein